ncbi:S26 family signal peptidase [Novosphingobium sp.]|uniref:S26 family signal peptidase n=1 Tax=Novosphingobium sp. TaxID=1874826 RepID=UPI0028AA6548|nr:S26 family signal peptidase [Novosphingobium sp.]
MNMHRPSVTEAPLRAFGDALRKARLRRNRHWRILLAASAALCLVGLTPAFPLGPRLVWNASPSAPLGLYLVEPEGDFGPGETVIARLPGPWRAFAADRRYLPQRVPLVKRIAAGPGQEICALGPRLFVNGKPLVRRLKRDGSGRLLPWWEGCRQLRGGEYFLLMAENRKSFDGRYFGVTRASDIIGPARLIWAR